MVWQKGQRLQSGKYVIEEVLGRGGFGITYKALHVELDEQVVIKTPDKYLRDDSEYNKYIERFIKEGRMLARISRDPHPHIVRVRDLFKEGDTYCLVMDFVPGENLFEVVKRRGAIPEAEIVRCIRQIGKALAVVHQGRLVHRDAHPGNIILEENGKAVLIDFGIAKEVVPATQSSTGSAGNQGFAPYEQLVKGSRKPNVDVYCLAATLYYVVTGQRPPTSLDRKLFNTVLIPPKQIIPNISDRLNQAILKGMALEAKDRPQSMNEWLKLLETPPVVTPTPKTLQVVNPPSEVPKVVIPSPVAPVHQQEVVRPQSQRTSTPRPRKNIRKTRTIPWVSLAIALLLYAIIGLILASSSAPFHVWAWAEAWAGAIAVDMAGTWAGTWAEARAWVGLWTWFGLWAWAWVLAFAFSMTEAWAWAGAVAGAWVFAVAGTFAMAVGGRELLKSFSRFNTFLILVGTSWLGLAWGWLVVSILQ